MQAWCCLPSLTDNLILVLNERGETHNPFFKSRVEQSRCLQAMSRFTIRNCSSVGHFLLDKSLVIIKKKITRDPRLRVSVSMDLLWYRFMDYLLSLYASVSVYFLSSIDRHKIVGQIVFLNVYIETFHLMSSHCHFFAHGSWIADPLLSIFRHLKHSYSVFSLLFFKETVMVSKIRSHLILDCDVQISHSYQMNISNKKQLIIPFSNKRNKEWKKREKIEEKRE